MKIYRPTPIDTSRITLPVEIIAIREKLAKNNHDVWAAKRIAEGWHWGEHRSDAQKLHPCLVPYEALSESEKAYDRNTAEEILKVLLALGFNISKSTT